MQSTNPSHAVAATATRRWLALIAALGTTAAVVAPTPSAEAAAPVIDSTLARSPELSETTRLDERRMLVTGERAWAMGTADGYYPAAGFHTRGEMGGVWTPSLKLLDGLWFGIDGDWIGAGTKTTSGWGYVRTDLPSTNGVAASRTDFVPAGTAGLAVGLTLRADRSRTVTLDLDAHSELMGSYPWGESTPSQTRVNLPDKARYAGGMLQFRDRGTPDVANAEAHDWAAAVGSAMTPVSGATGQDFRGPQDPAVICPASGPEAPAQPERCDDTAYGRGAGGKLSYRVRLKAGQTRTVWFGVGGSAEGPRAARTELAAVLADPTRDLNRVVAARRDIQARSRVTLPNDPLVEQSVAWSKQNLAASVQRSDDLRLRVTNAGKNYPEPVGSLSSIRWLGAGWPDYSWLFGTDGEYTAFAAVAAGQFAPIKDHLRALRDVSRIVNGDSGKIVHEVTPDGAVYFGANADAGNTDESSKFPSAVAVVWRWSGDDAFLAEMYATSVAAMRHVASLDADSDGWPEGLGNVEREGMGEEKLDNAVYAIRGYADLADLARARGDRATERWASRQAQQLLTHFEHDWWYGGSSRSYADSLRDPGNEKVFQRHWIGLTPAEAVLPLVKPAAGEPARAAGPLASRRYATTTLTQHERSCFTGPLGLYHTGTGPTSASGGNTGPSCDTVVSEVPGETSIFTLNSAIAAVAEGEYGRLATDQQQVYVDGNARSQLDPALWEMPGSMPEIVPGGSFGANIDRLFTERSMVLQAWGSYGVLWPVLHQWLGISPDMGRGRLTVVPQLPPDQRSAAVREVRLGQASVDVTARHSGRIHRTSVTTHGQVRLTIGAVVPRGSRIASATLDGRPVRWQSTNTARGLEVTTVVPDRSSGTHELVVRTR